MKSLGDWDVSSRRLTKSHKPGYPSPGLLLGEGSLLQGIAVFTDCVPASQLAGMVIKLLKEEISRREKCNVVAGR